MSKQNYMKFLMGAMKNENFNQVNQSNYRGKHLQKLKKIVLIGAGSAVFGLGTINDIFQSDSLVGSTIVLHDINEAALKKISFTQFFYI